MIFFIVDVPGYFKYPIDNTKYHSGIEDLTKEACWNFFNEQSKDDSGEFLELVCDGDYNSSLKLIEYKKIDTKIDKDSSETLLQLFIVSFPTEYDEESEHFNCWKKNNFLDSKFDQL